jgi:Uma2 family endonuclease
MEPAEKLKPATFEELWDALAEVPEGFIGEVVEGAVEVSPRPGSRHMDAASELVVELGGRFGRGRGGPAGWVIRYEPRLRFGNECRVPDLAGWRRERYVSPRQGPVTVLPDWICEVISPESGRQDRTRKAPLYAAYGVPYLWLVHPIDRTLEAYRLEHGRWVLLAAHGGEDRVRVEPFDAQELDLALFWGPPASSEP